MSKVGRNNPCSCGSGKKYKKCCLLTASSVSHDFMRRKLRKTEADLAKILQNYADEHYGLDAIAYAWDEFWLGDPPPKGEDVNIDLGAIFAPWFLYRWVPDSFNEVGSKDFPEITIAEAYVKENRHKLDSFQYQFIHAICSQPFSFFAVTEVEAKKSILLSDIFLSREIRVDEELLSTIVTPGVIIFARVLTMGDTSILTGCAPIVIPVNCHNMLIDLRDSFESESGRLNLALLWEHDLDLRDFYLDERGFRNPQVPPVMYNTDNEAMEVNEIRYRLNCSAEDAFTALKSLSLNVKDDELLAQAMYNKNGDLASIEFPWLKKGNKLNSGWDNTVMGHIEIVRDELKISVNSHERAEAIQRKITRRLGKRAVLENIDRQSADQTSVDGGQFQKNMDFHSALPAGTPPIDPDDLMSQPEVNAQIKEMANAHWRDWLDTPIPALKNIAPREAAKTRTGRERLELLLLDFENKDPQDINPFAPDVASLRKALGLQSQGAIE